MFRITIIGIGLVIAASAYTDEVETEGAVLPSVLDLSSAQQISLRDNPSLQASAARIEQAAARVKQARSQYFPTISTSASAAYTDLADNVVRQLPPGADDTIERYNADVEGTWLIFDGFGRKFRNALAQFDASRSEAAYQESQRLLLSAVAAAFYNVQLARENISIAEADEQFNERQLIEAQARRRVGTGSLSDVLNFEVRVREAQTRLIQAQGSHRVALIGLGALMGIPEADMPESVDVSALAPETPEELRSPNLRAAIDYGLVHRPDLIQSEILVEQAIAGVGLDRSEYYPSVGALASYNGERTNDAGLEGDDFSGTVGMVVTLDVFTGGRRRAQVQESKAFLSESERLLDQTVLSVASDVRRQFTNLTTAQRELVLQRETTQYVEQNRDLVEKEYDAGQGSLVRLNEAQRDLIAQRSRLALAQVALRLSWHNLLTATAEVLAPYGE